MELLLDTPHLRVAIAARRLVRIDRSAVPFTTVTEYAAMVDRLAGALAGVDRPRHGVLVDIRLAPLRTGDDFEPVALRFRSESTRDFARAAVLIQTQVGRLQLQRHAREHRGGPVIFTDEREALRYLSGG